MKQVKDYMKRKVISFRPDDSVFKVAQVLSKHHISGAPVVKNKKVIGIISESDIIKFMRLKLPEGEALTHEPHILTLLVISMVTNHLMFKRELRRISKITAKEIMSKDLVSITPNESIIEAATMFEKFDIDRLPVIKGGHLAGIITRSDLLRSLID